MLSVHPNIKLVVFDALTYAGNLGTLQNGLKDKRIVFIRGDIRSREDVEQVFKNYKIDFVVNFAA